MRSIIRKMAEINCAMKVRKDSQHEEMIHVMFNKRVGNNIVQTRCALDLRAANRETCEFHMIDALNRLKKETS